MALEQNYTKDARIFIGEDKTLFYPVYDQTDKTDAELLAAIEAGTAVPIDVSSYSLAWILRKNDNTIDPPLIEKESFAGISVVGTFNVDPDVNTQKIAVVLEDTDTWDESSPAVAFKAGKKRYSLKRTDPGLETVLAFGYIDFMMATARA